MASASVALIAIYWLIDEKDILEREVERLRSEIEKLKSPLKESVVLPNLPPPVSRVIWGDKCFAEYRNCGPEDQPWCVQRFDSSWSFYLDREEDVIELMKRVDAFPSVPTEVTINNMAPIQDWGKDLVGEIEKGRRLAGL